MRKLKGYLASIAMLASVMTAVGVVIMLLQLLEFTGL